MSSLTKANENLSASLLNITALEKSLSAADEKYKFMQKLQDFISIICDFLKVCCLFNYMGADSVAGICFLTVHFSICCSLLFELCVCVYAIENSSHLRE